MTYALAGAPGPRGVRVNAVHPGLVETSMTRDDLDIIGNGSGERFRRETPLRQICEPRDVANAVLYLASPLASFVNGESLTVDGGVTNTMGGREDG
jgi:NAD(P)-dependent dehydrogenase (short-subunit alcohol dehydrogenase family)